jgi:two-component system KDP operon response regulator KdpE
MQDYPLMKERILIVDDELSILKFVRSNLEDRGYKVISATNGEEALHLIERDLPDLIILDIMMPQTDGLEVCRRLREWSQIPIIMLSARGGEKDKVKCLDLGADDYIVKPFGTSELIARIGAVLRRTRAADVSPAATAVTSGDLVINFARRQVVSAGMEMKLTPTEYALLQELALNAGKVLTHKHLLRKIWGPEYREEREYLHVFVRRLRSKLEPDPNNPRYILTVSGVGYRFTDSG